ncbi:MAG: hypothetical protein KDD60_10280, partial [Bdellovibrionales bacterium]|nr:hypothetical protein [Bdellovibrionales bacterium]
MDELIEASNVIKWRSLLACFSQIDASYLPEYHQAYSLRVKNSTALLWHYTDGPDHFIYPFLLTPISLSLNADRAQFSGYFDISSIYGYTGPLATNSSAEFLERAWRSFDEYAASQKIVAEFIRFSPFNRTERF